MTEGAGPLLRVDRLSADYWRDGGWHGVLHDVSLEIHSGELVGLVGESGSGKSTLASLLMGERRDDRRVTAGSVSFSGLDLFAMDRAILRRLRGGGIAIVPQNSGASLTPTMRVAGLFSETLSRHKARLNGTAIPNVIANLLHEVSLAEIPGAISRFPHEFSGGQQQRLALALAFSCKPDLVVLDEPTTGLDPITRRSVIDLLRALCRNHGVAMLFISHDLETVAELCTRAVVMLKGEVVDHGSCAAVFSTPAHAYTQHLVNSIPSRDTRARAAQAPQPSPAAITVAPADLLQVRDISFRYHSRRGAVKALDAVSLSIRPGEVLALIGESGSGKSTLARIVAGLLQAERGRLTFKGRDTTILARRRSKDILRQIQIVFQNPDGSLNPRHRIATILGKPLRRFLGLRGSRLRGRVEELLTRVRLPASYAERYPSELSGGERQRVAIARALAAEPELLICDEITSALDVSVQASLLDLLRDLRQRTGIAILFVTHDLPIVLQFADRAAVLYRGKLCEEAPVSDIFSRPRHDYTARLVDAVRPVGQPSRWAGAPAATSCTGVPEPAALPAAGTVATP